MPSDWITLVSSVGFPIVVAMYLLIRMEGILTSLRDSIKDLAIAVAAFSRNPRE